jgi:hypothetical protein
LYACGAVSSSSDRHFSAAFPRFFVVLDYFLSGRACPSAATAAQRANKSQPNFPAAPRLPLFYHATAAARQLPGIFVWMNLVDGKFVLWVRRPAVDAGLGMAR